MPFELRSNISNGLWRGQSQPTWKEWRFGYAPPAPGSLASPLADHLSVDDGVTVAGTVHHLDMASSIHVSSSPV
jgi:hypothetical protein